jgi:predicted lipoprotein with Yx(FWY)xxD motif
MVTRALLVLAVVLALTGIVMVSPAGATMTVEHAAAGTGTVISAEASPFGQVLVASSGPFTGYSLYEFSRNTAAACTTTPVSIMGMMLSCTGPETDKSADWPALTTVGKPVAGAGVNQHLLGMVHRADIGGDQVTYAGQLLYLFDIAPDQFTGANFMETVVPLPPWHGIWYLVSPKNGLPVLGPIPLSSETLADGKAVLAAGMFQGMGPAGPITVYTYSKDQKRHSNCRDTCALDWPPVLTSAPASATAGLPKGSVGSIERSNGTRQLTYQGKPLYFYAQELFRLDAKGNPLNPPTSGNGAGLAGPGHAGHFALVPAPTA